MAAYAQSQFSLQERQPFDFNMPAESDSDNEQKLVLQTHSTNKKQKRLIDIDAIKQELSSRPPVQVENTSHIFRRHSKPSTRQLLIQKNFIPTSPVLIEQLNYVRSIKLLKEEVPPELLHKFYSELRYQYVPALQPIYRQGDHFKKFYFILDGKCVVMKPKEKMVGAANVDIDPKAIQSQLKKSENDPYGLKSAFPEYLILKVLFSGDCFGEAAIKMDTSRASTVLALENCHLAYVTEEAYMQLLDPYLSSSLNEKIQYFSKHSLFSHADINDIMGVLLECKHQSYKANELVYEENAKSKYIYFIINGQVELSKVVGSKNLVFSSYGEDQHFGEVEIMNKINRMTRARVITPRLSVYQIRRNKFFDNLGNYSIYEQLKRNANIIYNHWQMILEGAKSKLDSKDELYLAAQDAQSNKPHTLDKNLINKKIIEGQGSKLNQVKIFQSLTETGHSIATSPNKNILQRVYSNTLQQYQARLLKKPQQTQSNCDDCVRSDNNRSFTDRSIKHHKSSFHIKLPSVNSPLHQAQTLDTVLESISRLPKIPRDNLVLSLMYQQAYKSENPDKKAKQIQQVIQASFRNVRNQIDQRKESLSLPKHNSHELLLRNLKIAELFEDKKIKQDYVNFVQKKKISK